MCELEQDTTRHLTQARAIARGESTYLPTAEHLRALDAYASLLERTIQMALLGAKKEMGDLERWASDREAQSRQKVSA